MELNKMFCDHMVFQANKPFRVFGTGVGTISVKIDGISKVSVSNEDNWLVELPEHNYGGPYTMTVELNGDERIINDIYFGDVYLIAGQSNIEYRLWQTNTPESEYEPNSLVRTFFTKIDSEANQPESGEEWIVAGKENVHYWSAIGWLMAKELSKESGHAIGVVCCFRGATCIQSFLPKNIFKGTALEKFSEENSGHLRNQQYIDWNHDGFLYNEKFTKLIPYIFKAVIWYQGESNANHLESSDDYKEMLKVLINRWRSDLLDPELPFVVVQISDLTYAGNPECWKMVQKAQSEIVEMDSVYCVESRDVCENNNIHPPTKTLLSKRIKDVLKNL
ncbi:MAG: hypothetical protein J6D52_05420 [Clostridia bacterium]|nr:hypothetical protein [Clostridia bacterium]